MKKYLVTFPRTGSFFLKHLIESNSEITLIKGHKPVVPKQGEVVISIIRSPQDSIASYLAMLSHYRENFLMNEVSKSLVWSYAEYCRYFINDSEIIVDYDSLVKNPKKVLEKLSTRLNFTLNDKYIADFEQEDMLEKEHLSSSKLSTSYKEAVECIKQADLTNAIMYYEIVKKSPKFLEV